MSERRRTTPGDPTDPLDHRAKPRVPFCRLVRLQHSLFQDFIEAETVDISENGMFIQTAKIPVGMSFAFSIFLGDGLSPIEGIGDVIWHHIDQSGISTGMGIRFRSLKGESLARLRRIIAEHCRDGVGG